MGAYQRAAVAWGVLAAVYAAILGYNTLQNAMQPTQISGVIREVKQQFITDGDLGWSSTRYEILTEGKHPFSVPSDLWDGSIREGDSIDAKVRPACPFPGCPSVADSIERKQ